MTITMTSRRHRTRRCLHKLDPDLRRWSSLFSVVMEATAPCPLVHLYILDCVSRPQRHIVDRYDSTRTHNERTTVLWVDGYVSVGKLHLASLWPWHFTCDLAWKPFQHCLCIVMPSTKRLRHAKQVLADTGRTVDPKRNVLRLLLVEKASEGEPNHNKFRQCHRSWLYTHKLHYIGLLLKYSVQHCWFGRQS